MDFGIPIQRALHAPNGTDRYGRARRNDAGDALHADAVVHAYPDVESLFNKKNGISSRPGEKPGQFKLSLPPGNYYLVAEGTVDDIAMFSYHGINPISITDQSHWIPFFALETPPVRFEPGTTGISGTVYYKGAALAGGTVSVYQLSDTQFRGMGLFTNSLDDQTLVIH